MATITLDLPDELAHELDDVRDRLPELLALSLRQPAVPAQIYRAIVDFLAANPSPEALARFAPSPEMRQRLETLLERSRAGTLTAAEHAEIEEYERIEHLMVLIKSRSLAAITPGK